MANTRSIRLAARDHTLRESVELLADYGILAVRKTKRGQLTEVKHVTLGWMKVGEWAIYRGTTKAMATYVPSLIRAGYELKAWIWGSEINLSLDIIASGVAVSIPGGAIVVVVAIAISAADFAEGNDLFGYLDLAAIFLPFGELWLFYRGFDLIITLPNWLTKEVFKGISSKSALGQIAQNTKNQDASFGGVTVKQIPTPSWVTALEGSTSTA